MNLVKKSIIKRLEKIRRRIKRRLRKPPPYSYADFCYKLSKTDISIKTFKDFNYHFSDKFQCDISNDQIRSKKNVIIRHDVDHDPKIAFEMAKIEASYNIKSTYFALTEDSSRWWWDDLKKRHENLNLYLQMQHMGHEIALHYDFLGEFFSNDKDPLQNATNILKEFRDFGINIIGCSAHGSGQLRKLLDTPGDKPFPLDYINFLIWKECNCPQTEIKLNSKALDIPYMSLSDCKLLYESYFVRKDWYISDTGQNFWLGGHISKKETFENLSKSDKDPIEIVHSFLKKGEILQILIHPIWWEKYLMNIK